MLLGTRNSFSKTDPDATFKGRPHEKWSAQTRIQCTDRNRKPIHLGVQRTPRQGGYPCFQPHMEKARQMLGNPPQTVIADAGYGSEENYAYLEKNVGKIENWTYNETEDTWTCPAGQMLHFRKESKETLESGYEVRKRHYRSGTCEGCPLKERCTKAAGNREVVVSLERLRYQEQARQILRSEEGYALSVQRMTEPESVFGQLKNNRGFRRFLLRGMEKVTLEVGWLSLAHNLLKHAANDQKHRAATLQ
ncbi:transposase [Paenibacillus sp. NPDC057886]|uniref:transposase n=1 Tax=Paenibacillus sp. NPDC057886 TaxID=3346270 RepID=UPI0036938675